MKTLYKSIPENKTSHDIKWRLNKWYKVDDISICNKGFHASENIIDAMSYINCGYIAKVEVRGQSEIKKDKECWSEMRIVSWKKWTKKDSVSLAIFAAELVIDNYEKKYPNDNRPRNAIEAAKRVLKQDNKKNRSAAWSAESAAKSAASASSAESAAWSVSSAANAAKSAASASSAESVVWSVSSAKRAARSVWSEAESAKNAESVASAGKYTQILNKYHNFVIKRKDIK